MIEKLIHTTDGKLMREDPYSPGREVYYVYRDKVRPIRIISWEEWEDFHKIRRPSPDGVPFMFIDQRHQRPSWTYKKTIRFD